LNQKLEPVVDGYEFPILVVFDRQKDPDALYLGRTHPLVARVCDAVLGEAFSTQGDERFARSGAMFTDAVSRWTALVLLRFRYRFVEESEEFAEEIVLTAFERGESGPRWLDPLPTVGRTLADAAEPRANISRDERSNHVARAFEIIQADPDWFVPILDWRVSELEVAHKRLRALLKERPLKIDPHLPPDILGCFVLVPVGGQN
jgi:hypothetical protein